MGISCLHDPVPSFHTVAQVLDFTRRCLANVVRGRICFHSGTENYANDAFYVSKYTGWITTGVYLLTVYLHLLEQMIYHNKHIQKNYSILSLHHSSKKLFQVVCPDLPHLKEAEGNTWLLLYVLIESKQINTPLTQPEAFTGSSPS